MTNISQEPISLTKKSKNKQTDTPTNTPLRNDTNFCCIAEAATDMIDDNLTACCLSEASTNLGDTSCCIAESATDLSCFVATSSLNIDSKKPAHRYTYENHPDLVALRKFRDQILKKTHAGRVFIHYYYHLGPTLAQIIKKHASLRLATRYLIVKPFATLSRWTTR